MNFMSVIALCTMLTGSIWHASVQGACGAEPLDEEGKDGMPVVADLVWFETFLGGLQGVELEHKTFSPDGSMFAGYYRDGWDETISIHEAKTGKQIKRIVGHGDFVERFRFSSDGKHLATWSSQRGWKVWNVSTGKLMLELPN